MAYQGKSRRIRLAVGLGAVMAVSSTLAANALDAGSLLAPILTPGAGSGAAGSVQATPVAPFSAPAGGYAAFATGTVLHAGLVNSLAGLDFVSSTAAATSAPTTSPTNSELGRVALPVLPAKGSYGQGVGLGLDVGLLPGLSTGLFGNARAVAPPSTAPVEQEVAPISLPPLVHVSPFRAAAQALSSAGGCVLGSNLAFGRGEGADVSLAGQAALSGLTVGATGQPLSSSESRTVVIPGSDAGRLGLMSETSQTLAPVTLLAGTAKQTTVELQGQWALRVAADGRTGSVSYGPQGLAADRAAVVVRNAAGAVVGQATAGQMRLAGGLGVHLAVAGVGEIVVGEQPRARGRTTPAPASGTSAEAAVDLVRIRLLGQDVRLGHMEAAVAVPPAGVTCPGLDVSMRPDATTVTPGSDFGVVVRVHNPNEGTVSGLTVASRLAADPGVAVGAVPAGNGNVVAPNGAGFALTTPLGSGQSIELPGRVRVEPGSGPGRIRLGASVSGHYGAGPLAVPTAGDVAVDGPLVGAAVNPPGGPTTRSPVGGTVPVTAAAPAPAGSAGRRPARASAGITGAAGPAASAAPVAPAPTTAVPVTPPSPTQPPAPAPEPTPPPAPAPTQAPPTPVGRAATAAPKGKPAGHERRPWVGAASVLLLAVAAALVFRLGTARR
jgi:hypothetical protein